MLVLSIRAHPLWFPFALQMRFSVVSSLEPSTLETLWHFFFYLLNCRLKKKLSSLKVRKCYKGKTFLLTFFERWWDEVFSSTFISKDHMPDSWHYFFFLPVQEQSITHHSLIWNCPWLMKSFFFFLSGHWSVRCFHTGDHFRGLQWCVSLPSVTSSAFFPLSVLNLFPPRHPAKVLPLPVGDW